MDLLDQVMPFVLGAVFAIIICVCYIMLKQKEAWYFMMLRMRKRIWVRVHYANDLELWHDGVVAPQGLLILDKNGHPVAIDPAILNRAKNTYHAGINIVDVGSNSLWPVGGREGILVDMIERYISDPNNNVPRLKGMELLERHTLLHVKDVDLPSKIIQRINIDPSTIKIDQKIIASNDPKQIQDAFNDEVIKRQNNEIQAVIGEVHKVKTALEGRVVFDQPFSWSDACFTVNSQLQPEVYGKVKMTLEKLVYDDDKAQAKRWQYVWMSLIVLGGVAGVLIIIYKLLFG